MAWLQSHEDDPMVISVSDPETKTKGIFGKKKTSYVLRASSREKLTSVTREYKDFSLLHSMLVERFRGACIPPVPPEKSFGASNEDFITKRMHLLEHFMQALIENPFLRKDSVLDMFISNPDSFEKVMKAFDAKSDSEGTTMWRKALDSSVEPEEPEKMLKDIDKELDTVLKSLRNLKDVTKVHVAAIVKYAESTRALATAFESWGAREETVMPTLRGVATKTDGSKIILPHQLKAIVQGTSATASVIDLEYGAAQIELIVLDAVRFEIAQAERWKEQIAETQVRIKNHSRAEEHVKQLQVQLGALTKKPGHSEKQVTAISDTLKKAKETQKETAAELRDFQRGILVVELERYRKQRTLRVETMTALLTRTHLRGANMIKCAWDGTGLEMETNTMARQASNGSGLHGSFFRRKSLTRTASGRLRVKGAESNLEEELRREAETTGVARNLAIEQDEHRVTLKAKRDYVAKKKDELDLVSGETVTAVRIDDELWYATNAQGRSGLVPSSHVAVPISDNRASMMLAGPPVTSSSSEGKDESESSSSSGAAPFAPPSFISPPVAPPGFGPPSGMPPLPPPSRDPNVPLFAPSLGSSPTNAPPRPPELPDFMKRRGSGAFDADLPPLPRNVEALNALKAKLQSMTS